MSYFYHPDGRVEITSAEEVLALQQAAARLQAQHVPSARIHKQTDPAERSRPGSGKPAAKPNESDPQWDRFVAGLREAQRAVLAHLKEHQRVPRAEIVAVIEGAGRSFARTMETLKQTIADTGLKQSDIYVREQSGFGAEKQTIYVAGKKLLNRDL